MRQHTRDPHECPRCGDVFWFTGTGINGGAESEGWDFSCATCALHLGYDLPKGEAFTGVNNPHRARLIRAGVKRLRSRRERIQ